jgi:hypothetical protein
MTGAEPEATAILPAERASLWVRELPFVALLVLIMVGVAYTSVARQPLILYWELLAPLIGIACVAAGWRSGGAAAARSRLILTQSLHWAAFLAVMNLLLLPSVQRIFTANSNGLAVYTLLTLGAFSAGAQVLSWRICLLALIMALGIPAIAWIENSALVFVLTGAGALAVVVAPRLWREGRRRAAGGTRQGAPG